MGSVARTRRSAAPCAHRCCENAGAVSADSEPKVIRQGLGVRSGAGAYLPLLKLPFQKCTTPRGLSSDSTDSGDFGLSRGGTSLSVLGTRGRLALVQGAEDVAYRSVSCSQADLANSER